MSLAGLVGVWCYHVTEYYRISDKAYNQCALLCFDFLQSSNLGQIVLVMLK